MASGKLDGYTNNQYIIPTLTWSSTPNNIANTSNITVNFLLRKTSASSAATSGTGAWTMEINGQLYDFSKKITLSPNNTDQVIHSITVNNIPHNTDGSKGFRLSLTGGIAGTTYTSTTIYGGIILDTIPRASTISSFKFTNGYIDQGIDITIDTKSAAYYHDIHLYMPDTSGTGVVLRASDIIGRLPGGTHHINLTDAQINTFYAALPKDPGSRFTLYVRTYSNASSSITIGDWQTASATGNIPGDIRPYITNLKADIASGALGGLYYVQGKSTSKLTVTATTIKPNTAINSGSSIVSYTYSGASLSTTTTSTTATTGIIATANTVRYTVTAKDARGRTDTKTIDIYVYPYATPTISSATVQRCDSAGNLNSSGTYAKYNVNSAYYSVNGKNTRTITAAYSSDGGKTYSAATTIQPATNLANSVSGFFGGGALATTSSYTIKFTITDGYGASYSTTAQLSTAERLLNARKDGKGIAFGKMSEKTNHLETPWNIEVSGPGSVSVIGTGNINIPGSGNLNITGSGNAYVRNQAVITAGEVGGSARQLTSVYAKCFREQVTGYIGIRLGTSNLPLTSMITVKGHITSYTNSTSFEASCYYYNAQAQFTGCVATMTNPDMLREVYFAEGNPSGNIYLILGAPNAAWSYPTVVIESISVGYAGFDSTRWDSGWEAAIYTSLGNNFTKVTACARGGMKRTLWAGGSATIGTTITFPESIWNFKFLTCILGDTTSPLGIVLGTFIDEEIAELHFGAIYTASSGPAGADLFGCKCQIISPTSVKIVGAASETVSTLRVRKVVGWR